MNNYTKKIIIGFLSSIFLVSFVFAKDDCGDIDSINGGADINGIIFTEADIELAKSHLLDYCCRENLLKDKEEAYKDKCKTAKVGPDSPYRYDHLVDIGMRKLSAREMYDGMEGDELGSGWNGFLSDPETVKSPEKIRAEYPNYWSINSIPNIQDLKTPDGLKKSFYGYSIVPKKTLHDKYLNLCMVALYIYKGVKNIDIVNDGYYSNCMSLVSLKIKQETLFAVAISQNSAANMLSDSWTSYINNFVQGRLMKLRDKIIAISSYFNTIGVQAPLSKDCQK